MGKQKYLQKIHELFKKSPVVGFSSISRIVKAEKNVKQYAKQLVRILLLRGKIKKLARGYYSIHEDPSLVVFCFSQAYLGLQDALSIHNLWEQETIPVIVTPQKVRQGIRKVAGANVLIRRISKKYFFGFEYLKHNTFYLPVSDIEKTLIDLVYFKQPLDKELIKSFRKKLDAKRLKTYLSRYPPSIKEKILKTIKD